VPGRIVSRTGHGCPLEHGKLPDVEKKVIEHLFDRIEQLEQQLQKLQPK
jgi:serine O-acetyltransferase